MPATVPVCVGRLEATVPEGIRVHWRGKEFDSGPLTATLAGPSAGVLDYANGEARLQFRVKLDFEGFAAELRELGIEEAMTAPVEAVIESAGKILDDGSFALDGPCAVQPHALFGDAAAQMLPGT